MSTTVTSSSSTSSSSSPSYPTPFSLEYVQIDFKSWPDANFNQWIDVTYSCPFLNQIVNGVTLNTIISASINVSKNINNPAMLCFKAVSNPSNSSIKLYNAMVFLPGFQDWCDFSPFYVYDLIIQNNLKLYTCVLAKTGVLSTRTDVTVQDVEYAFDQTNVIASQFQYFFDQLYQVFQKKIVVYAHSRAGSILTQMLLEVSLHNGTTTSSLQAINNLILAAPTFALNNTEIFKSIPSGISLSLSNVVNSIVNTAPNFIKHLSGSSMNWSDVFNQSCWLNTTDTTTITSVSNPQKIRK